MLILMHPATGSWHVSIGYSRVIQQIISKGNNTNKGELLQDWTKAGITVLLLDNVQININIRYRDQSERN